MPTVTQTPVEAFAHCPNAQCLGYQQQPVQGVRTTTAWTYLDHGGDMPGLESSSDQVWFADEAHVPCSHCEQPRAISEQKRPEYPNISGHDPMGLYEFKGKTEGELREMRHQAEVDKLSRELETRDLRAAIEKQQEQIAALTSALEGKANRAGPKPKAD